MKVTIKEEEVKEFAPFDIVLTITSLRDLQFLYALTNDHTNLVKYINEHKSINVDKFEEYEFGSEGKFDVVIWETVNKKLNEYNS